MRVSRPISIIVHEGEAADHFYLLREGRVALQVSAPGRGAVTFLTLGPGEVFGVNWLVPPYRWTYDASALDRTRVIAMDALVPAQQMRGRS